MVIMHHFSNQRWLTELGGWEDQDTRLALGGLERALADGIDVRGYFY
jgi:beta-glucosidase/6-phospho-beta-glucosidase/beta-galactosidase